MPIPFRRDFPAAQVRAAAGNTKGGTRGEAAKADGMTRQIVRDWVLKFNAHGPVGLIDRKAPGQPSRLDATHRAALVGQIESGSTAAIQGVIAHEARRATFGRTVVDRRPPDMVLSRPVSDRGGIPAGRRQSESNGYPRERVSDTSPGASRGLSGSKGSV